MDEDLSIINTNTRNERIKRFIQNNKKIIISLFIILILSLIFFFGLGEYNKNKGLRFQRFITLQSLNILIVQKKKL